MTLALLKAHVRAHTRRTASGQAVHVAGYERWSDWHQLTAGKGITRWKTEAEAKKVLAEAKKKLGRKYQLRLKPVSTRTLRAAPGAPGMEELPTKTSSWFELEYRWPVDVSAIPKPKDAAPKAKRKPARPGVALVIDRKQFRAALRAKEKARREKEAAEQRAMEQAKKAGKKVVRFRRTPLKTGLEVIYKPEGAERARVGTIKRINRKTVTVQGKRLPDGTARTYVVPIKDVMAYNDYKKLRKPKLAAGPYEVSETRTQAKRQVSTMEGRLRKEIAERRLGRSEDEVFTMPKMIGYTTAKVDEFIRSVSGLTHGDFPELYGEMTVGMMMALRRILADKKTPARWVKEFREHMDGRRSTSDIWRLMGHNGRKEMIRYSKAKRERERVEETYAPQDVESPLAESLSSGVAQYLRAKYGQKLAVQPNQEQSLEEGPVALDVLVAGFLKKIPELYADVVRRRFGLGKYQTPQTFSEIAEAYQKNQPPFLDKYAWDRNHVGTVFRAAIEKLRATENIDVLRPFVKSHPTELLQVLFESPRNRLVKAIRSVRGRLAALMPGGRSRTLAVDFDGVIADYSRGFQGADVFGEPIEGAVAALQQLKHAGWRILIHTARPVTPAMEIYLQRHAIPYDGIEGKPLADIYLDDRARQFSGWERFLDEVSQEKSVGHYRLSGPLEVWFPGAQVLPVAWGTCIVAAEDPETLEKSFSSDLQKKYPGGRWVTITDESSPLHGRHIFILPHKGGSASVLIGGGPALQHKIFDRKEKDKAPENPEDKPKGKPEQPANDKPEMTDEQRAEIGAKKKWIKEKIAAERTAMAETIRRHMGVETEVTEEEKRAIEKKVEGIVDPKERQKAIAHEQAKARKEKDDTLQQIIKDVKAAVLEDEPTGQGKASVHAVVKEHLEEVLHNWYAIQALKKENRVLNKVLRKNQPFTSTLQSVEFERMDRKQLQDVIADEKMREAELDAHYKLMATARGVVEMGTEREIKAPSGNGDMVRNIGMGGFEAFTGVVGEFTGDTILKKARYDELGPQNAAVLAHWYMSKKLGSGLKDKIRDLQEYIEKAGGKIAQEGVAKGDRFLEEARKVIEFGRGKDGLMGAAQANATALRWHKKAWEAYGQAEGALTQAAELMHQFQSGRRNLEVTSNSRESLEAKRRKIGLSPLDAPIVKHRGEPYKLRIPEKAFEKIVSVTTRDAPDGQGYGMDGHRFSPEQIKAGAANTDDYRPGGIREYTPPDANGVSRKVVPQAHQQAAARLIAQQERVYLNHEAGTGKSLTVLLAKAQIEEQTGKKVTMIILMPGKTLRNYKGEVDLFTEYETVVIDGDKTKRAKQYSSAPAGSVVALNHEKMREDPVLIRELIARVKAEGGIPMVVVDEAHKLTQRESRTAKSQMSEQLLATVRESPYYVAMSGTPVPSDLSELYFHAHAIDPQRFRSQKEFMAKFGAAHKGVGLKDKIRAFMADELDDRVHTVKKHLDTEFRMHDVRVKITAEQRGEYRRIMEDARAKRIEPFQRDAQLNELLNGGSWETNPKFKRVQEIIDSHMRSKAPDEKLILYAANRYTVRQIQEMLAARYPEYDHVLFTGEEGIKQSGENKRRFKADPKVRFSIHMKAGVEGLNLQYDGKGGGATTAIAIASGEHTYATIDQFFSRANRTGALKSIDGYMILTDTPHDMATRLRLDEKKEVGELIRDKRDIKKAMRKGLLRKAKVRSHWRRIKTGSFVPVREHTRQGHQSQTEMDHKAYQEKVSKMTDAELRYTIADAREAIEAMPDGHKAGYYADEIHYCAMELNRRRKNGSQKKPSVRNHLMRTKTGGAAMRKASGAFTTASTWHRTKGIQGGGDGEVFDQAMQLPGPPKPKAKPKKRLVLVL